MTSGMMQTVLVTGGAGYVGSHAARALRDAGARVVVFDNLAQGHRAAIPAGATLIVGDLADQVAIEQAIARHRPDAVLHFAAHSLVGESMRDPLKYLADNVTCAGTLLRACMAHGVGRVVLSSTANLFGAESAGPIDENTPIEPGSPYGESKLTIERMLAWAGRTHGLKWASLRYFNAAGAHPDGSLGEDHRPETHLIPIVFEAALGQRAAIIIHGDDYPTPDGTCVRDFVHVCDLAEAHIKVLDAMTPAGLIYNLGSGAGHSVNHVVDAARRITGRAIPTMIGPRRPGDPAVLVASSARIQRDLGWRPRAGLEDIIQTAWAWKRAHPNGYAD